MKTAIGRFVIFLLGVLMFFPATIFAHGGGGGGGGNEYGVNDSSPPADDYFGSMGGGVSWEPNPNGPGILGSSIYDGRPANIEKGPYQSGTAIEDAEALLLWGYQAGNYTPDEVKEQLAWAVKVGLNISKDAQATLEQINNPPPPVPAKASTPAPAPPKKNLTPKELDNFDLFLKIGRAFGKKSTENKKNNKKGTNANDLANIVLQEIAKKKINNFKANWGF